MMIKIVGFLRIGLFLLTGGLVACAPQSSVSTASPREMKRAINASDAKLLLVHTWATWCDPCREEFPILLSVYQQFKEKGLELMLISADDPSDIENVTAFLKQHQCPVKCLISTQLDQEFVETFSSHWSGAMPGSFFFSNGTLLTEWEGPHTAEQFSETITMLLNK